MPDRQKLTAITILALVGLLNAAWLSALSLFTAARTMCGPGGGDCGAVLGSSWSSVAGIPLAVAGVVLYALIIALTQAAATAHAASRWITLLRILTGAGVLASAGLMVIQFFVLQSFCLFCTLSAVTVTFIAFLAFALGGAVAKPSPAPAAGKRAAVVWTGVAAVGAVFVWGLGSGISGPATIVGRIGNEVVREARMKRELAIFAAEQERLMQDMRIAWVSNTLTERMLEKEAAKAGKPVHTLAEEAMQGPVEVSDSVLAAMITVLAGPGAVITPAETLQVRAALARQVQEHRFERYVDSLRRVYGIEIHLQPMPVVNPQLDFTGSAGFGPADAPASFVVFTDFECPHCAGLAGTLEELSRRNPSKVAVTIKHYPLAIHPRAARAAEASLCAGAQGKFKEYHDLLFAGQKDLGDAALVRLAGEAGADTAAFRACLASGFHRQYIRRDIEEAERIGVTGTPTVFLNGRPLLGELSLDRLQSEVKLVSR